MSDHDDLIREAREARLRLIRGKSVGPRDGIDLLARLVDALESRPSLVVRGEEVFGRALHEQISMDKSDEHYEHVGMIWRSYARALIANDIVQVQTVDDYEAGYQEGFHHGRSTPVEPEVTAEQAWRGGVSEGWDQARADERNTGRPDKENPYVGNIQEEAMTVEKIAAGAVTANEIAAQSPAHDWYWPGASRPNHEGGHQ